MTEASIKLIDLQRYGFTDPASGKQQLRRVRARQSIVVIGVDWLQRIFLLFAWAGRLPTSRYIDKIIKVCDDYNPRVFGIESNAMQSLFADVVDMEFKRQLKTRAITAVNQSTKVQKDFRIRTAIEPVINDGRLFLPCDSRGNQIFPDAHSELKGFPTAATKDIVDSIASAIALVPPRVVKYERNEEIEALAAYLRRSGAPSHLIHQRIQQLYGQTH
jgi:hypothetical protein